MRDSIRNWLDGYVFMSINFRLYVISRMYYFHYKKRGFLSTKNETKT